MPRPSTRPIASSSTAAIRPAETDCDRENPVAAAGQGEVQHFEHVTLAIADGVAILTLDDQPVMNALSPGMLDGIKAALAAVVAPASGARCLLLTGAGRAFSTGANLQQMTKGEPGSGPRDAGSLLET